MPQLLSSLGIDDEHDSALDWGTVAVYSCSASCQGTAAYLEEFVWVQP
jgi:pre-rRNA-processing protein TSR4